MTGRKLFLNTLIVCAGLVLNSQIHAQTLQEAIQCAFVTNPDVLITTNDRLATDEALKAAQAGYLPTLDANLGAGRERALNASTVNFEGTQSPITLTRTEAGMHLDQMLFDGFATNDEVARNQFRDASAAYRVAGTANDIALRVTQVYLAVLQQQNTVALAKQNLDLLTKLYNLISQRTKAGIARSGDQVQAKSRLALAKTNYFNASSNLEDAITDYIDVVGVAPKDLVDPFIDPDDLPPTEQAAIDQAIDHHPTLQSAMEDVEAARAQAAAAHANDLPRIDLQVGADLNHNVDGLPGPDDDYIAMVRGRYNLFKGGADLAKERQTAFLLQEAMEVRNKTYRQVVRTTRLSWNALQTIEQQLPDLQTHYQSSSKTVGIFKQQFMLGDRTLLDLLDQQNEAFTSGTAYINGKYTDLFARYRVINAMGKLPQCVHVPLPAEAQININHDDSLMGEFE